MRGVAVAVGGLLLVGGATLVMIADHDRASEVDAIRSQIAVVEEQLDSARDENLELAERLTALRSLLAEQDAALSDTTGFLE